MSDFTQEVEVLPRQCMHNDKKAEKRLNLYLDLQNIPSFLHIYGENTDTVIRDVIHLPNSATLF